MSTDGLAELRTRVARDPAMAERLCALPAEQFIEGVTHEAQRLGLEVDPDELRAAIDAGRRAWTMRWIA